MIWILNDGTEQVFCSIDPQPLMKFAEEHIPNEEWRVSWSNE